MTEAELLAAIRLAVGNIPHARFWRNNTGALFDVTGRPVRFGVGYPGGSDLIGCVQVTVTPDMIGRRLAVFAAAEVKRPSGRVAPHQQRFLDFITEFGGVAGVVRSPGDALRLIGGGAA